RALPGAELAALLRDFGLPVAVFPSVEACIRETLRMADGDDVICALGSTYLLRDVYAYFASPASQISDSGSSHARPKASETPAQVHRPR
ncbi:MAG: hypothetical protein LBD95_07525, partial [Clostridiales Family XIII bacterium]|nr:hypothetical protein [Clostridiales Family XIII bacterium]